MDIRISSINLFQTMRMN